MTNRNRLALTMFLPFAALLAISCGKKEAGSTGASPGATQVADGKKVYDSNGCGRCHSINGAGGRGGPDLTASTRSADWIIQHVKNPKTHSPMSRMPSFDGRISDPDLKALASYITGPKT